jgi:hypothetical protein
MFEAVLGTTCQDKCHLSFSCQTRERPNKDQKVFYSIPRSCALKLPSVNRINYDLSLFFSLSFNLLHHPLQIVAFSAPTLFFSFHSFSSNQKTSQCYPLFLFFPSPRLLLLPKRPFSYVFHNVVDDLTASFFFSKITSPVASTSMPAGQSATINWQDDGTSPSLASFGPASIGLYAGSQQQQVCSLFLFLVLIMLIFP